MDMKRWLLVSVFFIAAGAAGQEVRSPESCDYGEPNPRAPAELGQFKFLIGDYRIHLHAWRGSEWSLPLADVTARWNGRYGLDGMVIVDEWFNPDPAQEANGDSRNQGINVRMYDPDEAVWKMMWIATANKTVQDLRAKVIDGVLTMWQVYPERPDFKAIFNVYDDHWERISYTRDDEGAWVRQYKLAATRIPCSPY